MREASINLRRLGRKLHVALAASLLAAACTLGGCASSGGPADSYAMATPASGPSITFDSVDGPPPQVFDRMVSVLDSETKLRNLAIVSRDGQATYRVRSYLSAQVVQGRTMIAWVWDVYDRDQQRTLRLSGEEAGGKAGRDPWSAADDLVLRKIAQAGLSGLSGMINGTPPDAAPTPAPATPGKREPAVASAEPFPQTPQTGDPDALAYTAR